jgi:hypothetical protein
MAPKRLPEHLIELGGRLLEATDTLGMAAQGAAWIYDDELEEWRFYLVTGLMDTKGPRWVHKRLLEAFTKLPERDDFLSLDVHLGSPEEILFRVFSDIFQFKSTGEVVEFKGLKLISSIDGREYEIEPHAIVYRMDLAPGADETRPCGRI